MPRPVAVCTRGFVRVAAAVAIVAAVPARPVRAQDARLEVGLHGTLASSAGLGGADAALRANGGASPFRLFTTGSRLDRAAGIEARVAVTLHRRLALQGRASLGSPRLVVSVTGDAEGAADTAAVDRLDVYGFEGGAVVRWPDWRVAGFVPFAEAGAGYVRVRHEGHLLIEEGISYYGGGGVRRTLWSRPRGLLASAGVSGDVRVAIVPGGLAAGDRAVRRTVASAGFFVGF